MHKEIQIYISQRSCQCSAVKKDQYFMMELIESKGTD